MSLATIREAIKARLEDVPLVGVVNAFEPLAVREEDFKTYFKHPSLDYLLGWTITREAAAEEWSSQGTNKITHLMVVRGYRPLGDAGATEQDFQDLVETVRAALRNEQLACYGGLAWSVSPPQVRILETRMFPPQGGYLVHYAELTQQIAEQVLIGAPEETPTPIEQPIKSGEVVFHAGVTSHAVTFNTPMPDAAYEIVLTSGSTGAVQLVTYGWHDRTEAGFVIEISGDPGTGNTIIIGWRVI